MKEKFIRINTSEGYENIKDCYWISNSDEDVIVNRNTGKTIKIIFDRKGYKRVKLYTKDKLFVNSQLVHIFIWGVVQTR